MLGDDRDGGRRRHQRLEPLLGVAQRPRVGGGGLNDEPSVLRQIDAVGPESVTALTKWLESDDGVVQYYAIYYLSKTGAAAKPALPALKKLQEAEGRRFRGFLEKTIEEIEAAGK